MVVAPCSDPRTWGEFLKGTVLRCHFIALHLLLVTRREISRDFQVTSSVIKRLLFGTGGFFLIQK